MSVTQAIGTDFRSQPRPGQWSPYRGAGPLKEMPGGDQADADGRRKVVIAIPAPKPVVERTWYNDKRLQSRWVLVKDEGGEKF